MPEESAGNKGMVYHYHINPDENSLFVGIESPDLSQRVGVSQALRLGLGPREPAGALFSHPRQETFKISFLLHLLKSA